MNELPQTVLFPEGRPQPCAHCGHYCAPQVTECPNCGQPLKELITTTASIHRPPLALPLDRQGTTLLEDDVYAILQVLPSGVCLSLKLEGPVVLGRSTALGPEEFLDLAGFNAFQHGVSRRHCMLQRRNKQLVVTDLGSSNSTYLNSQRILPYRDHVVAHGDKLILGTLHLTIFFSQSPQS
jgi:hypothetical protein